MDDDRDLDRRADGPVRFEASIGHRSRTPAVLVAIAIGFVAVILVHPWQAAPASSPDAVRAALASADAAAAKTRPAAAAASGDPAATERAVEAFCMDPASWRTATIEQWDDDLTVRVWRAIEPRPADGPTDPAIDVVPAVGESVPAIGYCAPAAGPDRPGGPAEIVAWRVEGDVATPIDLRQMAPLHGESSLGALFAPPLEARGGWPGGRYVFRHTVLSSSVARWFAVEVRTSAGPKDGSAAPPVSEVMQAGGGQGAFFLP
jgi:hypothetical protein